MPFFVTLHPRRRCLRTLTPSLKARELVANGWSTDDERCSDTQDAFFVTTYLYRTYRFAIPPSTATVPAAAEEAWCEEHEQLMYNKDGLKCGGCMDADEDDDDASVLSICCDRCDGQMLREGRAQDTLMGYCESGRADCPCVHPPGTDPCLDFNLCGRCAEYNDDEGVVWCIDCLEA